MEKVVWNDLVFFGPRRRGSYAKTETPQQQHHHKEAALLLGRRKYHSELVLNPNGVFVPLLSHSDMRSHY
jgi:hypothetical protein